jgi:hypothetical protein
MALNEQCRSRSVHFLEYDTLVLRNARRLLLLIDVVLEDCCRAISESLGVGRARRQTENTEDRQRHRRGWIDNRLALDELVWSEPKLGLDGVTVYELHVKANEIRELGRIGRDA